MCAKWGKVRLETMRLLLDALCDGWEGRKSYISWLIGLIRSGDSLGAREKTDLMHWLIERGYPHDKLSDLFTVQYTHDECMAAIGCSKCQSARYRNWLVSSGVLITVQPGRRGYPALFILAPVLVSENAEFDNQHWLSNSIGLVINSSEIGYHPQTRDLQLSKRIQNYPELSKEAGQNWRCSRCGQADFEIVGAETSNPQILCLSCDVVFPIGKPDEEQPRAP